MCKATDSGQLQLEGWQAIALIDTLREAIAVLFGAAGEMTRVAAGTSTRPAELAQRYKAIAMNAKAQLATLEAGKAASPVSEKDWYCDECGNSNVAHEAEVQWNRLWGCMEVTNVRDEPWCIDCLQRGSKVFLNHGSPVFGVKPSARFTVSTQEKEQVMDEQTGLLAWKFCSVRLPLRVCSSPAGYYLGTLGEDGSPYSRESVEYFPDEASASAALASGRWTQRKEP